MQYHGDGSVHHSAISKKKQSFLLGDLPSGFGMPQRCTQTLRSNAEPCAHQIKLLSAEINAAQQPLSPKCSSFMSSWKAPADGTAMHPPDMGSLIQACSRLSTIKIVCVALLSTPELFIVCMFSPGYCTEDFQSKLFQKHKEIQRQSTFNSILFISQREKKETGPVYARHVRKMQSAVSFIKNQTFFRVLNIYRHQVSFV